MSVVLCVALGVGACGGDSDAAADQVSAEVIAQVDEVRGEWRAALDADEAGTTPAIANDAADALGAESCNF